jgi:hypothetical protein
MGPTSAKQAKIDFEQDLSLPKVIQNNGRTTLPDGILFYIGRFIVKHPAIHLFLPASRSLAERAQEVFIDFAQAGGALHFVSEDPSLAVAFAKKHQLSALNLMTFGEIPEEDCDNLFDESWKIYKLAIRRFPWIDQRLAVLQNLTFLHLNDYTAEELSFITNLQALQTLRMHFQADCHAPLDSIHSLPKLKRLELSQTYFGKPAVFPQLTTMPGLETLKLETLLPKNILEQLASLTNLKELNLKLCEDETNELHEKITAAYHRTSACFTNLTALKLGCFSLTTWGFTRILDALTNLKTLHLEQFTDEEKQQIFEEPLHRISALTNLTALRTGDLILTKKLEKSLGNLGRLQSLELSLAETSSVSFLEHLQELRSLILFGCGAPPESFCTIGKLTNLATLKLSNMTLTLDTVGNLTTLTRLASLSLKDVTSGQISDDFAPLTRLPILRKIKITPVEHLPCLPLQAITSLSCLKLSRPKVEETVDTTVGNISTLTQLRHLSFRFVSLTHTSQIIEKLTLLEKLTLHGSMAPVTYEELTDLHNLLKSKQIRLKNKRLGAIY